MAEANGLTVKGFCERFCISEATAWRYMRLGKVRSISVGNRRIIPPSEVERIDRVGVAPVSIAEAKRLEAEKNIRASDMAA